MSRPSAIITGAGIVGMAVARALSVKGYSVKIFERNLQATGASIRNFGMIWPIGQPEGKLYDRAMCSRNIWQSIGDTGAFWYDPVGSLHLAYHDDEWQVLQELYAEFRSDRSVELLTPAQVNEKSCAVIPQGLKGGLFSSSELIV